MNRITTKQYEAICIIIDHIKIDEKSEDTDGYAGAILQALDLSMPVMYGAISLKIYCGDAFEVFKDEARVAVIHPSLDGWAVHRVTENDHVVGRRVTTTESIPEAVRYIEQNLTREAV